MARDLQSRYEKDERGAYYEWRWEVHRILFSQSVLLREGRIRVAPPFAPQSLVFEKIVSHAILTTNSGKEKSVTFLCFGANYWP